MFTHLKAAEAWLKTGGGLPVNVKFLIEGEEEVGGANLEAFVAANHEQARLRLRRDLRHQPVRPRHAGDHLRPEGAGLLRGDRPGGEDRPPLRARSAGRSPTRCNALATILASLKGPDGRIQVAGFYDPVRPLEDWERAEFAKLPFSEAEFQASLGVPSLEGEAGYTTLEREVGPADLRRQRPLRRLPGARPQDGPALQGRREAELPPRARPGPEDRRRAVPRPRRERSARRA